MSDHGHQDGVHVVESHHENDPCQTADHHDGHYTKDKDGHLTCVAGPAPKKDNHH